jgi:uncharacterized iron-regulated protein
VPTDWQSKLNAAHPLVGTLVRVRDGAEVAPAELAQAATGARFVLLGETHDNPDHHRLQAWVVEAMAARGRRPAVAFEMIGQDQAPALAEHLAAAPDDAAGLGPALNWSKSGWPAWETYQPIAEAALAHDLPLLAANPSREATMRTGREGYSGPLSPASVSALALDRELAEPLRANLMAQLKVGHCNMLPESALAPMAKVQRLRDAMMADALIQGAARTDDGAVLITGRGHARGDRGVPWYLRARLDDPSILSVGIVEALAGQRDWRAYLPDTPDGSAPAFDYLWVTPRFDDTDHCAEFKKQMEQMRHGSE